MQVRRVQNWVNAGVYAPCLEKEKATQTGERQLATQKMEKRRSPGIDRGEEIVEAVEVEAGKRRRAVGTSKQLERGGAAGGVPSTYVYVIARHGMPVW